MRLSRLAMPGAWHPFWGDGTSVEGVTLVLARFRSGVGGIRRWVSEGCVKGKPWSSPTTVLHFTMAANEYKITTSHSRAFCFATVVSREGMGGWMEVDFLTSWSGMSM